MSEENKTLIEQVESLTPDSDDEAMNETTSDDLLKEAVEKQLSKIRTQSMLIGAQTACSVILQKITAWEAQPGKRTLNDHRRLIKEIKEFCNVGVSRKVNPDGTTSPRDENENDNTKLMEEVDD